MTNTHNNQEISELTVFSHTFKVGDMVHANITKNGYWKDMYRGTIVGFTANGRIKVKSWRGIKIHAAKNVQPSNR